MKEEKALSAFGLLLVVSAVLYLLLVEEKHHSLSPWNFRWAHFTGMSLS